MLYSNQAVKGALNNERFLPRFGHMAECFALLLLIVAGEGFFKPVITLAEKVLMMWLATYLLTTRLAAYQFSFCAGYILTL